MAREKEIKIQLTNLSLDDFVGRIQEKGFSLLKQISQEDIYFDTKDWYLYENFAALRLRKANGKDNSFSFKKVFYLPHNKDHYYVEEIEVKFPITDLHEYKAILDKVKINPDEYIPKNGEELIKFLRKYGYFDEQHMAKLRKVFRNKGNEIVIDNVDKVGIIIELECQEDEPLEIIQDFLSDNEWKRSIEGTSYMWLEKFKGLVSHKANLNKFEINPLWNVWENERLMYESING